MINLQKEKVKWIISQDFSLSFQKGWTKRKDSFIFWLVAIGLLLNPVSGWTVIPTFPTGEIPESVVTGNFNNDDFDDLAVTTYGAGIPSKLYIFFSDGQGNFNLQQVFNLATSAQLTAEVVTRQNRPSDLSVLDPQNQVTYNFQNTNGRFTQVDSLPVDPRSIASGNFLGNGQGDLVFASPRLAQLSIFYSNADGTSFTPGPVIPTTPQPTYVATGDVNNDGFDDIIVAYALGDQIKVFLNDGTGNFTEAGTYSVGTFPSSIVVGDLNNDGFADIAVTNGMSNSVSVLLNRGGIAAGTFFPAVNYSVNNAPISLTLGNFNGSGNLDIATANEASSTVSLLVNNGNGTFQNAIHQKVGSAPLSITSGRYTSSPLDSYVTANAGGTVTIMAQRAASSIALIESSAITNDGEPVTFTATISPGASPNPLLGSVQFLDGTTVLGIVPVTFSGGVATAALTTSDLRPGTHVITAVYLGDINFEPSISNPVTHTVLAVVFPPRHLRGHQTPNRFAAQTDYVNVLTWKAPKKGNRPVKYRIYRNSELTKLAKTVPAHRNNLFKDHNRRKGVLYHYFVVSVDAAGHVSEPEIVAVHPKK